METFPPLGDIDPSMPRVRFSEEERAQMKEQGMTDEEIDQKEIVAMNKIADSHTEEELTN